MLVSDLIVGVEQVEVRTEMVSGLMVGVEQVEVKMVLVGIAAEVKTASWPSVPVGIVGGL